MGVSRQDDEFNQWETENRSFDERMSTSAEVRQLSGLYLLLAGNTTNIAINLKDLTTQFYFSDIMLWYLEEVLREMSYPELAKITGLWFLMTGYLERFYQFCETTHNVSVIFFRGFSCRIC